MPSAAVRCFYDTTQTPSFSSFNVAMKPFWTSKGSPFTSPSPVNLPPILCTLFLLPVTFCTSSQLRPALWCVSHVSGGILGTIWPRDLLQAPKSRLNVPFVCTIKPCPLPLLGALCRQGYCLPYSLQFSVSATWKKHHISTERKKNREKKCWEENKQKIIVSIKILNVQQFLNCF